MSSHCSFFIHRVNFKKILCIRNNITLNMSKRKLLPNNAGQLQQNNEQEPKSCLSITSKHSRQINKKNNHATKITFIWCKHQIINRQYQRVRVNRSLKNVFKPNAYLCACPMSRTLLCGCLVKHHVGGKRTYNLWPCQFLMQTFPIENKQTENNWLV